MRVKQQEQQWKGGTGPGQVNGKSAVFMARFKGPGPNSVNFTPLFPLYQVSEMLCRQYRDGIAQALKYTLRSALCSFHSTMSSLKTRTAFHLIYDQLPGSRSILLVSYLSNNLTFYFPSNLLNILHLYLYSAWVIQSH